MAKTQEELNALKEKAETVSKKRQELTEEGLEKVSGGLEFPSYNLSCTNPNCLINSNTYFSGGISGNENGIPCPICSSGTWVVTVKK